MKGKRKNGNEKKNSPTEGGKGKTNRLLNRKKEKCV